MSIFEELFHPGARHREEEKRRLEWMRDEEGEGDPHRGPINLDSGVVQIRVGDASTPASAPAPAPAPESKSAEPGSESEQPTSTPADREPVEPDASAHVE